MLSINRNRLYITLFLSFFSSFFFFFSSSFLSFYLYISYRGPKALEALVYFSLIWIEFLTQTVFDLLLTSSWKRPSFICPRAGEVG